MRASGGKKCRQAAASRVCAPTGGMLCAGAALRFSPLALRSPSARTHLCAAIAAVRLMPTVLGASSACVSEEERGVPPG